MKFFLLFCILLSSFSFDKTWIKVKDQKILVEIAKSDQERSQGLMHRKELKGIEGMLFIFPQERILSFWMKNTKIPLSIAFFNKDKILIDIQDMEPHKGKGEPKLYKSKSSAKYALEVPKGWFSKKSIGLGSRLELK